MLWRRSAPRKRLHAPEPVPDIFDLRRSALQASWQRDRSVGKRRVALRWVIWWAGRYGLSVLLALGAAAFLWLWFMPRVYGLAQGTASARVVKRTPQQPSPPFMEVPAAAQPQPAEPDLLQLRLERYWAAAPARRIPVQPDDSPAPQLKPDNWLHSQEP